MNSKEKVKFFEQKGQEYHQKLANTPKRVTATKKIVKFKNKYDVRPFNDTEKVTRIS